MKTLIQHEREVVQLCRELQSRSALKATLPKALGPTPTSHQTRNALYKEGEPLLNLNRFNSVIEIDKEAKTALVEPKVTMENLIAATLPHGLMPLIVCEFKEISVGGAIMGAGLESSSHRYGQFNDSCEWIEGVLSNGERLRTSPTEEPDLFYALAGSYGTLCWVTLASIRLIPAPRYVRLSYSHYTHHKEALATLTTSQDSLFLDAVSFAKDSHLVVRGEPTENADVPMVSFNHRSAPWFAHHLSKTDETEEYLTMQDYLFRFDLAAFWMGQYVLNLGPLFSYLTRSKRGWKKPLPNPKPRYPNPLFRTLFGPLFSSKRLYEALHRIPFSLFEETFIVQDCVIPCSQAESFLEEVMEAYEVFPLWLCPIKAADTPQFLSPHSLPNTSDQRLLNVGIYGVPNFEGGAIEATKDIEAKTRKVRGRKGLYSHSYYSKETFWEIYDCAQYEALRKTYHASSLNRLDEKVLNK